VISIMLSTGRPAAFWIASSPTWAALQGMTRKSAIVPSQPAASTSSRSTSMGMNARPSLSTRTGGRRWYQTTMGG